MVIVVIVVMSYLVFIRVYRKQFVGARDGSCCALGMYICMYVGIVVGRSALGMYLSMYVGSNNC